MASDINHHLLTVGLPLYNSGERLRAILDALLNQDYKEYTLLISDNCSTDETGDICQEYKKNHPNISYIRQDKNIGLTNNFTYVLENSTTKYFMWATDDDFHSPNFISKNIEFLELNVGYIGSGSRYKFNNYAMTDLIKTPSIVGDFEQRLMTILENCWNSNGYAFSIYKAEALKGYKPYRNQFLANDWARLAYLSTLGNINVLDKEFIICGSNGVSNSPDIFSIYAETVIERFIPFYIFTKYIIYLSNCVSIYKKYRIFVKLIIINANGIFLKIKLKWLYRLHIMLKPIAKLIRKSYDI